MGNKCEDENWHCCFPLSITAQTSQTRLQLSLVCYGPVHRTCLQAQLVRYQISACSTLFKIFSGWTINLIDLHGGKKLTWCTVNELQVVQSRSTTHILCSYNFKYENKVPQVPQRHFRSSPFPVHLPLCPHLPQLIFCLSITTKAKCLQHLLIQFNIL